MFESEPCGNCPHLAGEHYPFPEFNSGKICSVGGCACPAFHGRLERNRDAAVIEKRTSERALVGELIEQMSERGILIIAAHKQGGDRYVVDYSTEYPFSDADRRMGMAANLYDALIAARDIRKRGR